MNQINITGTDAQLILDRTSRTFTIISALSWEFETQFIKDDLELSLDENGDVFEISYILNLKAKPKNDIELSASVESKLLAKDVQEIAKIFAFIEDNKKNIFELLGIRGVLE
ncbi:hypothetical protein SAMN02910293_00439 [Streptococcus henryi]|uniref:Phage protein n=1 Tax=Streptococcus henryi TaxID=439219 RepID=A0A1G6AKJ0_9STRE|nr:hypothetical protein [Streptococcus henryi]QBX25336.1 hypothetical protein Javan252_0035 [Streptococcus phage Javan252]SDB08869.1 hypothetical protein SAMN02910293_00439 [Streptococcus henryi]